MLCICAWVHCSPSDSPERLSPTKIHYQVLACRRVDYCIFALCFCRPLDAHIQNFHMNYNCAVIHIFWRQSPFNCSNGWTSELRRRANQRAESQISARHHPHQTACQATAYPALAQSIQCLSAHVLPSECAIFISGEMITVSDKPIIKSQILAKTQWSTRAVFLHCLLDVIRRRFCVWALGIKKPSCPKCLCDTVWQKRIHDCHLFPVLKAWATSFILHFAIFVIFMADAHLLTLNQYQHDKWAHLKA